MRVRSCAAMLILLRGLLVLSLCACASGPHAAADQAPIQITPETLYPLQLDFAWSYDVDSGDGQSVLATSRVINAERNVVEVKSGQGVQRYILTPEGIAHAGGPFFLLRAPIATDSHWPSAQDAEAHVIALGQRVSTPAGTFQACVVIREDHTSSGQRVTTTYCPRVGPVRIESQLEIRGRVVRVQALLRGHSVAAP